MNTTLEMELIGSNAIDLERKARRTALDYFQHPNFHLGTINAESVTLLNGTTVYFRGRVTATPFEGDGT